MNEKIVIVLDCGATNVRAVAINTKGAILAIHKLSNNTSPDPDYTGGLIWDIEEIWQKLCTCIKLVVSQIDKTQIAAITVTTFGVNGAPVDMEGKLLYPVISWQCQRTVPLTDSVETIIPFEKLYAKTGVHQYSFNTLYTLMWLKQNRPKVIDRMEGFLFISSLFIHKLCGKLVNDTTMAGTSMLTDITTRQFSDEILTSLGLPNRFLKLEEAGTRVGEVRKEISELTNLPAGVPVVLAGHDTQFSLIGSGAGENEAVLNSGTWEILMTRSRNCKLDDNSRNAGLTNELDVIPGLINTGSQWLGSGVLEWIKHNFYSEEFKKSPSEVYSIMIDEGRTSQLSGDLIFTPEFVTYNGGISGIGMNTSRGQIYRAALEGLALKTREALGTVLAAGQFETDSLIIAGGGTKNQLWNQIRANTLGKELKLVKQTETTVLGAAIIAMASLNIFSSVEEGVKALAQEYDYVYPE